MTAIIEDEALVLGCRPSGETGLLLYALTQNHGLVRGYVLGVHLGAIRLPCRLVNQFISIIALGFLNS